MPKRNVPYLVFGILITAVASCRSTTEINQPATSEPEWVEPSSMELLPAAGMPLPVATEETSQPSPSPAWPDTSDQQTLGDSRVGISLTIPASWANFTGEVDTPAMANRMGINILFAADSERTARSLLAGKSFASGAYVSGLLIAQPLPTSDQATALVELLSQAAPSAVRLTPITNITSANQANGVAVDVGDGAVGLNASGDIELRTRVALFAPTGPDDDEPPAWIAVLLSASSGRWEQYVELFDQILESAQVFTLRPGNTTHGGQVTLRGEITGDQDQVRAVLENGVNDLWTFTTADTHYASLFLQPGEPHLDLNLTLLGPDRQLITHVANGYDGMTESVVDLPLPQPGTYIVEVSDFDQHSGLYSLSLSLTDQPQYSEGGFIGFGQIVQGELPANGQHSWLFTGAARQHVSVVVEPGSHTVDTILELYGPDGQALVILDEGFSGDPEVLSGFELPAAGEYAILVRSFSTQGGPYTISLDEGGQPASNFYDAGDLAYGDVRQETLQPQEAHAWFLHGKAGDHVLIRVTPLSANLDLDVWLLDGQIERVAAADTFAAGEPETIEMTLSADGQYIILVRDFNGEVGEYQVALGAAPAATPETAGSMSYGDTILSAIMPGVSVTWTFEAQAGDVIDVIAQAADSRSDMVLQLQGPDGLAEVEVDENSAGGSEVILGFAVPDTGIWQIVLHEFFGDAASYQLKLDRTSR